MKAIRVREFGGPDVLSYDDQPRPDPAVDELLVRVHAAGVNPIDWLVREGYTDEALQPSLPWTPGWDLSGVVVSAGESVTGFAPGDAVYGMVRMPDPGAAYAEYATVPASHVVAKPPVVDHVTAAAVPMVASTAWRALFGEAGVSAGDHVLVHGAAGGVGHLAVQFAGHAGATVTATASARDERYLRGLGVDRFVDYRDEAFESAVDDVDMVLDTVGGDVLDRSVDVVAAGGDVVTLPEPPAAELRAAADEDGVAVHWFSVEPDSRTLETVTDLLTDAAVWPTISGVLPLAEAAVAHRLGQRGRVRGKLVLDCNRSG